jgi:hypothetical protein
MTVRRAGLAVLGAALVAIAVVDPGWIPSYLVLVAVAIGAPWALVRLSRRGSAGADHDRRPLS